MGSIILNRILFKNSKITTDTLIMEINIDWPKDNLLISIMHYET